MPWKLDSILRDRDGWMSGVGREFQRLDDGSVALRVWSTNEQAYANDVYHEEQEIIPLRSSDRGLTWERYDGLPCLCLPRSPLSALCYEWAGVQDLVYLLLDCEDKVLRALDLMEEQEQVVIGALCDLGPPLVHFPDNLSSDNLTSYYDEHMRDRHQRRLAKLHAAGTRCAVHLDGTVAGLLPKLVASGFDAIEALTPHPAGDLTVAEMQDVAGDDRVILWGGAPGAMFAPPYSWDDMEQHVEDLLATWGQRPFILGVADQVPPDGDIEFCRKIAELVS